MPGDSLPGVSPLFGLPLVKRRGEPPFSFEVPIMAALDDLKTARDNIAAKILEISSNPKPTYSIDGQSVQHGDYFRMLSEMYDALNKQIAASEPYVHVSQVL